jgi:GTP-binding protein
MQQEARDRIAALHAARKARQQADGDEDDSDDGDDDDYDVEVVYRP